MRLEDRIEQIRQDIAAERYTTAAKESASVIEFAFREIYRRSIGEVDGRARQKAFEVEQKIGGPGKDIRSFTLGELVRLFRESKLFDAYSEATGGQLRAITMIDFGQVVAVRNRMHHDLYDASRGEAQLFLHCVENMLEAFGILTLEEAPEAKPTSEAPVAATTQGQGAARTAEKRQASGYEARGKRELARLAAQGAFQRPLDLQMFRHAVAGTSAPLLGIDIGCAQGDVTFDRFGQFEQFHHIVGVDKDPDCVEAASAKADGEHWSFRTLDIEDISAEDELRALLAEHEDMSAVIVFMAFVLNHVGAPIRVLKMLRSVLPSGSKLVIRSGDDFFTHDYPDESDRLRSILELTEQAPGADDRRHGRKLYHQLYRAGYRDVRMFAEPILLPNLTEEERRMLFAIWFHHRPDPWKRAVEAGDQTAQERLDILNEVLEEYELDMEDPSFFFFAVGLGAVASLP